LVESGGRFRGCAPNVADRTPSRLVADERATPVALLHYQRDSLVRQVSLEQRGKCCSIPQRGQRRTSTSRAVVHQATAPGTTRPPSEASRPLTMLLGAVKGELVVG
jgi:hypothetical protein